MPVEPSEDAIRGLYTPGNLAGWLGVPVAAIRRWHRRGYLQAGCEVGRLPYFAMDEVHVARPMAELLAAGCSLAAIDKRVDELSRLHPELERPLGNLAIVVEGRRILVRQGEQLLEVSGQRMLDFDGDQPPDVQDSEQLPDVVPLLAPHPAGDPGQAGDAWPPAPPAEQLREWATEAIGLGEYQRAIEYLRSVLVAGCGTAEDHFNLGELLYRAGDLAAARERYFVAIEIDEQYLEARANLGCVLAELNELPLAEAALRGALDCHPHYADAHYQLAKLLDRLGRGEEAATHWQQFRSLAPDSPWVEEADDRLDTPSDAL